NVKKAFVPSRGKKSSEAWTHQPEVIAQTTYRVDYAKRGRPDDHPDEAIFAEFRKAMDTARGKDERARSHAATTVIHMITQMRNFSVWLQMEPRNLLLAQLIDDPDELDVQVTSYLGSGGSTNVKRALEVLRISRAGRNVVRQRNVVRHSDCEALITQFKEKLEEAGGKDQAPGPAPGTIRVWVSELRKLGEWLQTRNLSLPQLIDDPDELDVQVTSYLGSGGSTNVKRTLEVLRISRAGRNVVREACETLITQFQDKLDAAGGNAPNTIRQWVSELRKLDDWLQTRNLSLAQLIDDPDELDVQVTSYLESGGSPRVKRALEVLRSSRAGMNLSHFPRVPYPEDGQLIDGHLNHVGGAAPTRAQSNARGAQRRFGDWLRSKEKASIASRLNSGQQLFEELKEDFRAFGEDIGRNTAIWLDKLQKYQQVVEANAALGIQPAKEAGWPQRPDQSAVSSYDQDPLWDQASIRGRSPSYDQRDDARSAPPWDDEPSSATARSSHIFSGLDSLVDLPSTPYDQRDDARSAPAWDDEPSSATARSSHIFSELDSLVDL
ncbi:hypothetical protein ACC733_36570, partial [Rhizobium johnstonii]